jgi:hypothetical protein
MEKPNSKIEHPGFRELEPVDHWSASVPLEGIADDDFDKQVKNAVVQSRQNFFGFRATDENLYFRTRYPRRKYGIYPIEEMKMSTDLLSQKLGVQATEQTKVEEPRFRVVIGLVEGYDKKNKTHTLEEVAQELGGEFNVRSGEIYTVKFLEDDASAPYKEPAAIVEGDMADIQKVYELAEKFHQERFTIEDLHDSKAFVVETKFCTAPDIE